MAESPLVQLRAHARFAPWNARGLASHVTGLVDAAGVRPTNASARAAPSARAVRFYVATKLMDRPVGAGTSATYHYRHFLQLLAIKIRQREGMNLQSIREELRATTGDALERRVAQWLVSSLATGVHQPLSPDQEQVRAWRRVAVADGVELHIREDALVARDDRVAALREATRTALGRLEVE